jgi:tetratricopeptide (TPR) repeat protein
MPAFWLQPKRSPDGRVRSISAVNGSEPAGPAALDVTSRTPGSSNANGSNVIETSTVRVPSGAVRKESCVAPVVAVLALSAAACRRTPAPPPPPAAVTFNKDVAPILFANCAPCHHQGEVAPFPLVTYADAVKHADGIAEETRKKHMPPWLPERGEFAVLGERRLSDDRIAILQRWADSGRLEGNPADLPQAPSFPDGWRLGRPDAVVTLDKPFVLQAGGADVYRNLVVRSPAPSDMFVRGVEFRTNGAPIHHAVIRLDRTGASRARDGADGRPGFDGMTWQTFQDPDGQFIGWAPGRGPIVAPDGMPWRLERGTDLVIELHMLPQKKPASIQPTIALFASATPPARTPVTVKLASKLIDIPAGAREHVITETYQLPVAVDLLGVYPHAHYLATDMLVTAKWPDGATRTLLHIPHWSFHWQQDYRYATPIALPSGTVLQMRYTYDNSEGNGENPSSPPVRVRLGPNSTDEMAELGLQVLTASLADSARLVQSFDDRDSEANVALGEARVRESPDSADDRAFYGKSLLDVGRAADAVPQLEAALRLDPKMVGAENDLGAALMSLDRHAEALAHLQRAAARAPRDETIAYNLGNAFAHASRPSEAAAQYARALAINPSFADAHVNLGNLLYTHGRTAEALPHFQRAAALMPNSAVIHANYGGALAAAGQYADALRETRRALDLNPNYAPARENLARLRSMGVR